MIKTLFYFSLSTLILTLNVFSAEIFLANVTSNTFKPGEELHLKIVLDENNVIKKFVKIDWVNVPGKETRFEYAVNAKNILSGIPIYESNGIDTIILSSQDKSFVTNGGNLKLKYLHAFGLRKNYQSKTLTLIKNNDLAETNSWEIQFEGSKVNTIDMPANYGLGRMVIGIEEVIFK